MRDDSPRWEEVNPSEYGHEKDGLRELASYLPDADPFHVWANVEFVATDGSINEVDALVLTRSGLYVVELKHWLGEISGNQGEWVRRMPRGRLMPAANPLVLANRKAKRLAGLIRHYARQQGRGDDGLYVGAAVFLHARSMRSRLDEIGSQHVYGLDNHDSGLPSLRGFLLAVPRAPGHAVDATRGKRIVELVKGAGIRPSVANRTVGQVLLLPEPFAEGLGWQDFLGGHVMHKNLVRRVRFYLTSRAPAEDVPVIRRAAEREFRLLQGINHPGIARVLDMHEHGWGPAVVFEHDPSWIRLDHWLVEYGPKLSIAQRLQIVQDLAEIIGYAHLRRLSHRALNPRAIYVANPTSARPSLVVTDWQAGGRLAGSTQVTKLSTSTDGAGLELFFDDEVRAYQAPEAVNHGDVPGTQLDVFSLGALAYRIFSGEPPAATPEELVAAVHDGGLNLAAVADGIPNSLLTLVYDATHGNPSKRVKSASAFHAGLDDVWEELTRPDPEPVVDPLDAQKGTVLEGGFTVLRRLGTGATATALLVSEETPDGAKTRVLKVARDEQYADRLDAEAGVLKAMRHHWQVAELVTGPVVIGGRTALVLESAGERTLADELSGGRRLALDLLERYGRDLMDIVNFLEGEGVWHRDLKPANLAARPRPKDRQLHLCVFDFSLAAAPADQIAAGTHPYLDPFLGPPRRMRYDAAADRFAAAVTLYEMATGSLPRWGDNANPAAISDEVTIDPGVFDTAIADRLAAFFARALRRDSGQRFDTAEEMADAWRTMFKDIPTIPAEPAGGLTRESLLDAVGLTARARSALERLGVHTIGELLDYEPSALTRAQGVPDATRKEILSQVRALRARLPEEIQEEVREERLHRAQGIEAISVRLLPGQRAKDYESLAAVLGQSPVENGRYLGWLSQTDAAAAIGLTQPQVSTMLRKQAKGWLGNDDLKSVRDEVVALLEARGGVMSAGELAEALIAARGSYSDEPKRTPQAIGLVRAAVETELTRGGDSRVAIQRFRASDVVLVGREPEDPTAETTAADLLAYAVSLGRRAAELAGDDPLNTRTRAVEELRRIVPPGGALPVSDVRLLQIAAAASNNVADVNAQGQIYPVGMDAERALRLARNGLLGQTMGADQLRSRVRVRFPRAQPLPSQRYELDQLLVNCEVPLLWDDGRQAYVAKSASLVPSSTRMVSTGPLADHADAVEAETKLQAAIERRAFLAILAPMARFVSARRTLVDRLGLTELNVTAHILRRLRELDFPWDAIVAADSGRADDPDFRSLAEIVAHEVMPGLVKAISIDAPLLLTDLAPLARYGQLRILQELADPSRPRAGARLLLVPARRPEPAMLDAVQLPLTSPASQSLWLPGTWPLRTAAEGIAS
ncbi:serine/threonine protein kinase [Asanoa ferruginea]|uniref:non-specific serine/threonine protein kinase n=1 Tax=Asanoa ferruginea TaxID=53367 RepID=A0A3D9ZI89_9ACTN|nr:BREX system serine/threonine kinase PglW [Asanoa ferruginea]REF96182.1 serine/threonine protein kinase [Asanoa ferruginea]GIF49326.1 protein kinase [Asanoa ferruginea]